ncbi:MAG: metallophosphoesterase, partial [Oscillospiraceae bacterium]|nr:metallophosphoesterase [Oscillospiraceae bacterium]
MKRTIQCLLSAVMVLLLLFAVVPAGFMPALAAEKNSLQIGLLSDIHIFPEELTDGYGSAFQKSLGGENKQFEQSEGLLASALAALESHAKKNGMKAVLISGDLTKDGELEGHQKLAKTLKAFEKRSGLQVLVIPGNHDINNIGDSFVGGVHQDGTLTSPEQFREIYKNLGYGEAGATYYQPPAGKKGGMLSYALDLPGGYRLIALDTCKYSKDQTKEGKDYQNTGGMLSKELLAWAVAQSREAVAQGKTVLGMGHHNLTSHMGPEDRIFLDFMLDDWLRVRETLADAGMHFYFSGHIHVGEIGDAVSDSGEALYDVCTAALSTYPNSFRELRFTREGKKISAKVETYDVDCVKPVAANGVTYPQPYTAVSFDLSFDKDGIGEFLTSMVDGSLTPLLEDMQKAGGLSAFLGEQDLDLEGMIDDALNGGVKLGQIDIFTAKNVMGLVNDVLGQVDKNYINQPERLTALLNGMIGELMDMQVSSLPSTQFLQSMGLGDPQKPGTLEDLANEVIVYAYTRQPGAENDRFLMDAIRGFESGDSTDRLISLLLDMILNDLLEEELLPTLKLNLSPVFTQPLLRLTLGTLLDGILRAVLLGDNSFAALVDLVFQLGVLPYDDLQDVVDSFLEEYWSPSQSESIGGELADFMRKFCIDAHDYDDSNTTLVYSGKKKVTPTTEAFQLPSLLVQTFGGDAATTRNISWFTKDTVKGTDLRLTDAKTGKSVLGRVTVQKSSEAVTKTFPGADLGTFGLFDVPNHLVRHTVRLSNLIPGKTYRFQVGDAAKGWWSEQGSIQTADGSKTTTFLSFSDQQAQMETQYARAWGKLSREALRRYPLADFIVSPGDQVDSGT